MNAAASDQPPANSPDAATPGELLRRERERRGVSLQQAAEDLHLDAWTVEALEQNRFSTLGAPVYAKGYLRKYAALLDLSPEVIIARYESVADRPAAPTPIPIMTSAPLAAPRRSLKTPLLILAALIALAVVVWLVRFLLSAPSTSPGIVEPLANPSVERAEVAESPEASGPAQVSDPPEVAAAQASAAAPSGVETPSEAAGATQTAAVPTGPSVRLRLEFSGTSWAEVHDATDRRLMFGLGEPGRVRNLTGVAPLRVTLGAASAVTAYVNDEQIVIPRREGRDASKFVVDASGAVRPGER
jgi:cytoskeleton protein RodZ